MPTHDQHDPVGQAIEDNYKGQHGVYTGRTFGNAVGYGDWDKKQRGRRVMTDPAPGASPRGGNSPRSSSRGIFGLIGLLAKAAAVIVFWPFFLLGAIGKTATRKKK